MIQTVLQKILGFESKPLITKSKMNDEMEDSRMSRTLNSISAIETRKTQNLKLIKRATKKASPFQYYLLFYLTKGKNLSVNKRNRRFSN